MNTTLINGVAATCIDAHDRGFHYGDGLFETFAVSNGEPAMWDMHMQRLLLGCQRLGFPAPDPTLLRSEALSLCAVPDAPARGVLKIIITRGGGGRGYRAPSPSAVLATGGVTVAPGVVPPATLAHPCASRMLALYPWPDYPAAFWSEGVVVRVCATRLGCNPALAGIKHLNRLEQVLARNEWDDASVAEGLMLDPQGSVIEGTMTNLFVVRNGQLLTPDVSQCGVAGVMRSWILAYARMAEVPSAITPLTLDMITSADEIFLCNSVIGLWPVREIMGIPGCNFQVNGPITSDIMAKLRDSTVS